MSNDTDVKQELREDFLVTFIKALLRNSYTPKPEEKKEDKSDEHKEQIRRAVENVKGKIEQESQELMLSMMHKSEKAKLPPLPKKHPQRQKIIQKLPMQSPVSLPRYQAPMLKPGQKPETVDLGKVASLLRDPAVFSVEVPGPTKQVLVNRGGQVQTTSLSLNKEEIDEIMNNVSDKTRIPLISGLFKAAYQDLIITAVVSEFVGTRFMIQKRLPFQQG